jgi:polyribonucleotide nucleotidyltransferase
MEQLIENMEGEESKRYIHHYYMPPFSVGETGRVGSPSRREIGHGALAERALEAVVPDAETFPYTIRVVSEIMSSNGSTSMASVCGSTLSLMDAGVPIKSPVSGIAMGMVSDGEKQVILSDIIGQEDFNGDMDFKIAGTKAGITAIQMDVKKTDLSLKTIEKIFKQAQVGRFFILEKMLAVLDKSRTSVSKFAPKIEVVHIPVEKIGEVIGPGGKIIKKIIAETGAVVDVEDDGSVSISSPDNEAVQKAVEWVKNLVREVKAGEIFEGTVKRIQPFGAFVEVLPGKEGLVHVSRMSTEYVNDPAEVVTLGQKVPVRVTEIDDQHRINLSMILDAKDEKPSPERKDFGEKRFDRRSDHRSSERRPSRFPRR